MGPRDQDPAPEDDGPFGIPDVGRPEHRMLLMRSFTRRGLTVHDAEDCVQETLLRVQGSLGRYVPRAPFGVFLRLVARSVYADWCRRQRVRRAAVIAASLEEAEGVPAVERLAPGEILDLQAAVSRLPPRLAAVVALTTVEGLDYRTAAERLGIPVGTVKSRMFLAVRRLREELLDED